MTPNDFRRLALGLPDVTEQSHMNHPDFRVGGKIFATMGYPDETWAMVSLPPVDQDLFIQADPEGFVPVNGAWGKQGATNVRLVKAKKALVKRALEIARRYRIEKSAKAGKGAKGATGRRGGRRPAPQASSGAGPKTATTSRRSRPPTTPSRRRR
jgi:hypothetical protein